MNYLKVEHLTFAYMKKPTLFSDVNFSLDSGVVFVMGEKGSGKTTLLEILCGLNNMALGNISVFDKPVREQSKLISYLPAKPVLLENQNALNNLKFACDAIGESYDKINEEDEWLKLFGDVKAKKMSSIDRFILSVKRTEIKNSKLIFVDASDDFLAEDDYVSVVSKLKQNDRLLMISVSPEMFKKLQNLDKNSEILYINRSNIEKFSNFEEFKNSIKFAGMAEYLNINKTICNLFFNQNGYYIEVGNRTIKIAEKYVTGIKSYFEVSDKTEILLYGEIDNISDDEFNKRVSTGEILMFDKLSGERLI